MRLLPITWCRIQGGRSQSVLRAKHGLDKKFKYLNHQQSVISTALLMMLFARRIQSCHILKLAAGVQIFLGVGGVLPLAATIAALTLTDSGPAAVAIFVPYILTLGVQVTQENAFIKQGWLNFQ